VQPSGSLDVYIENSKNYSQDVIENMSGWNLKEIDTTKGHDYLSPDEKSQIILINKIKSNPKLFAQQYLIHLTDKGESYREIYQKLMNYPKGVALKPSRALFLSAKDHAIDIGDNGTTGHKSTDGSDLKMRISRHASEPKYFGENCAYGLKEPVELIIHMLVDDGLQSRAHRANILNQNFSQVGLVVKPHASYKFICVQVFGAEIVDRNNLDI
jgi:hypothetical protein